MMDIARVKSGMNDGIQRTSKKPKDAFKLLDSFKQYTRFNNITDTAVSLSANEITHLEKEILHILRWRLVSNQLLSVKDIGRGANKHTYNVWLDVRAPNRSQRWLDEKRTGLLKEETTIQLIGIAYNFEIDMIDQDAFENQNVITTFAESLKEGTFVELWNSLMEYRERIIFRGADIPTTYGWINTGETGLVNDANLTDSGSITGLTSSSGVRNAAVKLAMKLVSRKYVSVPGNRFQLHMSSGVYMQALQNINATNTKSDMVLIDEMKIFDEAIMNPYLINSFTETNTTGAMAVFARSSPPQDGEARGVGAANFRIVESYPPGSYPLPPNGLEMAMKILWMGRTEIRRPGAIAFAGDLTVDVFTA